MENHQDDNVEEKKRLLSLVNQEGFIFEATIENILSERPDVTEIRRGEVLSSNTHRVNTRVEIDCITKIENRCFIIEAKKSSYDWNLLENEEEIKDIHFIRKEGEDVSVINGSLDRIGCVSKSAIEIKAATDNKGKSLLARSTRDEYVHAHVRQALFSTEAVICNQTKLNIQANLFITVIVTNAKLFAARYNNKYINEQHELTKVAFIPIEFAAFNHSEVLWNGDAEIQHIGRPNVSGDPFCSDDKRFKGSQIKTVFIVSANSLNKFIDMIKHHIR